MFNLYILVKYEKHSQFSMITCNIFLGMLSVNLLVLIIYILQSLSSPSSSHGRYNPSRVWPVEGDNDRCLCSSQLSSDCGFPSFFLQPAVLRLTTLTLVDPTFLLPLGSNKKKRFTWFWGAILSTKLSRLWSCRGACYIILHYLFSRHSLTYWLINSSLSFKINSFF